MLFVPGVQQRLAKEMVRRTLRFDLPPFRRDVFGVNATGNHSLVLSGCSAIASDLTRQVNTQRRRLCFTCKGTVSKREDSQIQKISI